MPNDMYHPTVQKIQNFLDEQSISYKCFEHKAVRTSEEAAAIRPEYSISQGAKALIVRMKKKDIPKEEQKQFVQIVVPGDAKFDSRKARHALHAKDIRFATPEEVFEITEGIVPGGVPPFGNLFGLEVYVEETLLNNSRIIFNAGDRSYSMSLTSDDYNRAVQPNVVDIMQ